MGISLDKDYIDLAGVLGRNESYTDFEGLASSDYVEEMLDKPEVAMAIRTYDGSYEPTMPEVLRTLLAHYVYENLDQGDYRITEAEAVDFVHSAAYVLGSRHWMKIDLPEDKQ